MPDIDVDADPFATSLDRVMRVRQDDVTAGFVTEEIERREPRRERKVDEIRRKARAEFEARFGPMVRP